MPNTILGEASAHVRMQHPVFEGTHINKVRRCLLRPTLAAPQGVLRRHRDSRLLYILLHEIIMALPLLPLLRPYVRCATFYSVLRFKSILIFFALINGQQILSDNLSMPLYKHPSFQVTMYY